LLTFSILLPSSIFTTDDVLIDPVLRLAYDYYGEPGVSLIKRIQQHRREQRERREEVVAHDEDEEEDDDDEVKANLYDRVERLLNTNNPLQAREELQRFFEQHDYNQHLTEENQVQLACSMEFPQVIDLKRMVYQGRDYIKYVQKSTYAASQTATSEERQYYQQRLKQEKSLIDYQLNRFRDAQRAEVGFTLSSVASAKNPGTMTGGNRIQPKWSMAMGGSTNLVYPDVAKVMELTGKNDIDQKHPASMFINAVYQPVSETQINLTSNLTNDQSHQVSEDSIELLYQPGYSLYLSFYLLL
jgi:hypothetical protein